MPRDVSEEPGAPEPPPLPPPPAVAEALARACASPGRAVEELARAAESLVGLQARNTALLLAALAAALAAPALGGTGVLVALAALAASVAVASRVMQAMLWTVHLRRLRVAVEESPGALEEYCAGLGARQ